MLKLSINKSDNGETGKLQNDKQLKITFLSEEKRVFTYFVYLLNCIKTDIPCFSLGNVRRCSNDLVSAIL